MNVKGVSMKKKKEVLVSFEESGFSLEIATVKLISVFANGKVSISMRKLL